MAKLTLEELIDIAFAHEEGDPINWGVFTEGKAQVMKMIGTSVLEQFDKDTITDEDRLVLLATITKLIAENMILHTQMLTQSQKDA